MNLEDDEDYPLWLGDFIIQDKLPWQQGLNISFQEFTKKYTLHDSCWIGLFYDIGHLTSVTLVINWDAVWLPDSIALNTSGVKEWPFLFIKIGKVKEVSVSGYLDHDISHFSICDCQIESIDEKQLFIISSCMGGDVEITFLGDMTFLALDYNKNILNI